MKQFHATLKQDYDKRIKLGKRGNVFCYSREQLDRLYPEGDFNLVGEARLSQQDAEVKEQKAAAKAKEKGVEPKAPKVPPVGRIRLAGKAMDVEEPDRNSGFLYSKAGYLAIGEGQFIILRRSRIPFFLILLGMLVAIAAVVLTLILWPKKPPLPPTNELPPLDPNIQIEETEGEKIESPEGGGSVSMIYTLKAEHVVDSETVSVYFRNPYESNHDVVVELYIVQGVDEYLFGRSDRVPAAATLTAIKLDANAPILREGGYSAMYRVLYYNPDTGEQALVQSDIPGVTLEVKSGE